MDTCFQSRTDTEKIHRRVFSEPGMTTMTTPTQSSGYYPYASLNTRVLAGISDISLQNVRGVKIDSVSSRILSTNPTQRSKKRGVKQA